MQTPTQDCPAVNRSMSTRRLQAPQSVEGGGQSCGRAPSTGTNTKTGNQGRVTPCLHPQCPLGPVAGTGKTSLPGPLALRVRASPFLPQTAFLKDTLSLPFLQTANLVVTQTSTITITKGCHVAAHLPLAELRCSRSPQNPHPATGSCQDLLKGAKVYKLSR